MTTPVIVEARALAQELELKVADLQHVVCGKGPTNYTTGGAAVTLAEYRVPASRCLIITRIDLDAAPIDPEDSNVIYDLRGPSYYTTGLKLYLTIGGDEQQQKNSGSKLLANKPIFFLCAPGATVKLLAESAEAAFQLQLDAALCAYLAPADVAPELANLNSVVKV